LQILFNDFSKQHPNFKEPECYLFRCQIETDPGGPAFLPLSHKVTAGTPELQKNNKVVSTVAVSIVGTTDIDGKMVFHF